MGEDINTFLPIYLLEGEENKVWIDYQKTLLRGSAFYFIEKSAPVAQIFSNKEIEESKIKRDIDLVLRERKSTTLIFMPVISITTEDKLKGFSKSLEKFDNFMERNYSNANLHWDIYPVCKIPADMAGKFIEYVKRAFVFTDKKKNGEILRYEEWFEAITWLFLLIAERENSDVQFDVIFPRIDEVMKTFACYYQCFEKFKEIRDRLQHGFIKWITRHLSEEQEVGKLFIDPQDEVMKLKDKLSEEVKLHEDVLERFSSDFLYISEIRRDDINLIKQGVDFYRLYCERVLEACEKQSNIYSMIDKFIANGYPHMMKVCNDYIKGLRDEKKIDFIQQGVNKMRDVTLITVEKSLKDMYDGIKTELKADLPTHISLKEEVQNILHQYSAKFSFLRKRYLEFKRWRIYMPIFGAIFLAILFVSMLISFYIKRLTASVAVCEIIFAGIVAGMVTAYIRKKRLDTILREIKEYLNRLKDNLRKWVRSALTKRFNEVRDAWMEGIIHRFREFMRWRIREAILHFTGIKEIMIRIKNVMKEKVKGVDRITEDDWYDEIKEYLVLPVGNVSEKEIEKIIDKKAMTIFESEPKFDIEFDYKERKKQLEGELPATGVKRSYSTVLVMKHRGAKNIGIDDKHYTIETDKIGGVVLFLFETYRKHIEDDRESDRY